MRVVLDSVIVYLLVSCLPLWWWYYYTYYYWITKIWTNYH